MMLMRGQADPKSQAFIDKVGLGLLVVWVGALQIMLDEGRNKDWFTSPEIRTLGIVAAIGFVAFLIWELTEKNPIVDLKIFRHRGFVGAATTYAVGFGGFFASIVLLPLWLQSNMGYTATWAGYATGHHGHLGGPVRAFCRQGLREIRSAAHRLRRRARPRRRDALAHVGVQSRRHLPADGVADCCSPAVFMVMFFVPVTGLAMASVDHDEQANAAGLSNFMRTLAGAFATSLIQSGWSNATRRNEGEIVNAMQHGKAAVDGMLAQGIPLDNARAAALAGRSKDKASCSRPSTCSG